MAFPVWPTVVVTVVLCWIVLIYLKWRQISEVADPDPNRGAFTRDPVVTATVRRGKTALQMTIGTVIVTMVLLKLLMSSTLALDPIVPAFLRAPVLEIVGNALAVSAAIDLAYMLFTPGPDEAIEPVILGMAATILILISGSEIEKHVLETSLAVLLLASAIALLFYVRDRFLGD